MINCERQQIDHTRLQNVGVVLILKQNKQKRFEN